MEATIYLLRNPISKSVFYIGKTTQSLKTRLGGHVAECNSEWIKCNTDKKKYIKEILDSGNLPEIEAIEILNENKNSCKEREIYWINHYKSISNTISNKITRISERKICKTELEETILMRVTFDLKSQLQRLADLDKRKLTDFCRVQLENIAFNHNKKRIK